MEVIYNIVIAASKDAGHYSANKNGRSQWNEKDYNAAVEYFIMISKKLLEVGIKKESIELSKEG